RRAEVDSIARTIEPFRAVRRIEPPGTVEGGDILCLGRTLYAGKSRRTNEAGIVQLRELLLPFGYQVISVEVTGCLHLKSACCPVSGRVLLVNRDWIDVAPLAPYELIDVPEPWGANVLRVGDALLASTAFPQTRRLL